MNLKTYLLFISLFIGFFSYGQTKAVTDSIVIKNKKQIFIGVDLLNPVVGFFSDRKNYSGYVSYQIKNRWVAVAELGYDKNTYDEIDWNVDAKGFYGEIGINYILTNYYEKTGEGFYVGGRLGFSPYKQTINQYPVKGMDPEGQVQTIGEESLPEGSVSSGWLEAVLGAKVQIGKIPLYIDFMIRPKILIYSEKQDDIDNLVIPGYGKDKGAVNISLYWGISYRIF